MAVIGTQYSVRDESGAVLCHSAGQSKANADSKRKRAVREGFALMCASAGMHKGTDYVDVVTGAWLPMADADTPSDVWGVVERGHVIADASNGAFCPCNLVPENRGSNKGHGNRSMDPRTWRTDDPRKEWRAVWLANYASPSKARRAV